VVIALRKGLEFNAAYSPREIRYKIKNWGKQQEVGSAPKLNVHADHAIPHRANISMDFLAATILGNTADPLYSPDLALLDFFLFVNAKRQLSGCSFDNTDGLLKDFMTFWMVTAD
jgi:hypothetical protein